MEIKNIKIYFGKDAALGEKIFKKLKELGADGNNMWKKWNDLYSGTPCAYFVDENYFLTALSIHRGAEYNSENPLYKEISEDNLFAEKAKIVGWKFKEEKYRTIACSITGTNFSFKKDNYNFSVGCYAEEKLIEFGVLEIWCTPVYEEEFKVGDWVCVESPHVGSAVKKGHVAKIIDVGDTTMIKVGNTQLHWVYKTAIRKATEAEIQNIQSFEIGDYPVIIKSKNCVEIDGVVFTREEITKTLNVLNLPKIGYLIAGCYNQLILGKNDINIILDKMNNF